MVRACGTCETEKHISISCFVAQYLAGLLNDGETYVTNPAQLIQIFQITDPTTFGVDFRGALRHRQALTFNPQDSPCVSHSD